ncbi:MAG: hypothetical protein IT426_05005 [Pirellulales bacterium]|nr:hypothetical protein [Pirellulales bacterium]
MDNTTWSVWILGLGLVLFLGFLLAAVIALLAVPSTRKVGWTLLAIVVGVPLILLPLAAAFFWVRTDRVVMSPRRLLPRDDATVIRQMNESGRRRQLPDSSDEFQRGAVDPTNQQAPPEAYDSAVRENPPAAAEENQPLDKALTAESARLIDALSRVLAKTILEDPQAWRNLAAKAEQETAPSAEKVSPPAEAPADSRPATTVIAPALPEKPAWVDRPLHREGSDYYADAVGDPFATPVECEAALAECVQRKAVDPYVEILVPNAIGGIRLPTHVLENLVVDRWVERRNTSQGEMQILHARVLIDRKAQDLIEAAQRQALVGRRLVPFGFSFGTGFLLLSAVWGYLKIDLATGGKRRGILRTALLAVILSIAAAAAIAVRG